MGKASVPLISTLRTVGGGAGAKLFFFFSQQRQKNPAKLSSSSFVWHNRPVSAGTAKWAPVLYVLWSTSAHPASAARFPSFFALPSPGPAVAERWEGGAKRRAAFVTLREAQSAGKCCFLRSGSSARAVQHVWNDQKFPFWHRGGLALPSSEPGGEGRKEDGVCTGPQESCWSLAD